MPTSASPSYDAAILGLKLTAGAEMLLAEASAHGPDTATVPSGWPAFEASLVKCGYFQSLLPGSAGYQQRLQQARGAFAGACAGAQGPAERARGLLQGVDVDAWRASRGALAPADSDAWMRDGAADLEAELAGRQAERDAHDAAKQQVAERVAAFVEGVGDLDGAEVPAALDVAVDVSMDAVLRELRAALGVEGPDDDAVSSDEGSSFFSDPATSGDDEDDPAAPSEAAHAPGFFAAYLDELESQLSSSTVPKTFDGPVDVNLVANLLASVDMQEGMAGPASNLAGMVGLDVGSAVHHCVER